MFPYNLHKNIVQLDRQISLLENECKNMEIEKRKRAFKADSCHSKCSKISSVPFKPSPVKVSKNTDRTNGPKRNKKPMSPASEKLQSISTSQSPCSQQWSDNYENAAGKKTKTCRVNTNVPVCSCQKSSSSQTQRKIKKSDSHSSEQELCKCDHGDNCQQDQVLHKEVLYSNSGGAIEVTVTQKSGSLKDISPIKKTTNLEDKFQKDRNCKCQTKGQKWSEILSSESAKRKSLNTDTFLQNKLTEDESKPINQPNSYKKNSKYDYSRSQGNIISNNISNVSIQEENFEAPVKLSSPMMRNSNQPQMFNKKKEKEVQCVLENINNVKSNTEPNDPVKIIQHLVSQLKLMPMNELKQFSNDVETSARTESNVKKSPIELYKELESNYGFGDTSLSNISPEVLKQRYESLLKDKELLSKELAAKNGVIATMNEREEEYLSLISTLKLSLEKTKENAQESIEAMKEINMFKEKLLKKIKFSDTVQENFAKAHNLLEKYILENQKLKTQIKILTLEAQKNKVLLAGKEAEISKYKEEIQNFQRLISSHLAVLKSNAQGIDVEKMMEAIFQQSQIFIQTDLDSAVAENDQRNTSKVQNALMHSSPTSTRTSIVNSSWKQISSIHENDHSNVNEERNPNEDRRAKDFFQIFGDNISSVSKSTKKSNRNLIETLNENEDLKRCLSFTSCMSANDDHDSVSDSSSVASSLSSKAETLSRGEKAVAELEKSNLALFEKAQSNVNDVLKNMKLKLSPKFFEISHSNFTTDDFLDSQISSISQ